MADLNGDGKPDIIVTNKNDNTVGVLLGNGDGTFEAMTAYPVASGPTRSWCDDLNRQRHSRPRRQPLQRHRGGRAAGQWQRHLSGLRTNFRVGSRPYGLAVADLNGDGKPDIVTANYRDDNVSVLLGNGDGTF